MLDRSPSEIAREAFKRLAEKRLPPTPENYQTLYHEVAGTLPPAHFPFESLRQIAAAMPARNPGQEKQLGLLESAIGQRSWDKVEAALVAYGGFAVGPSSFAALEPASGGADPDATTALVLEQVARLIECAQPALGKEDARFAEQTVDVLQLLRRPQLQLRDARSVLGNYALRLSFAAEDQAEIRNGLLNLLNLVFENIGELCMDDRWMRGQIDALRSAATPPLNLRRLDDVERRLKDVIFKQTEAKGRAYEAQLQMRQLLATFVDRLSLMTETSSTYHAKIEQCARQIEQATTLEELGPVLQEAISATRAMARDTVHSRDELQAMRAKTQEAEAQIVQLHVELDRVSALARHDALTGVLNRRGLDETLQREVASARRKSQALCVSLLDVDNFKRLNDQLGHDAGDKALLHLTEVARMAIRPQDSLARYGGEEFVIVLPDTVLADAIAILTRLQRELTTRYFLNGKDKVLITFSAGVAQLGEEEAMADALKRADAAMYLAKRTGKNRVLGG
ncbi:GGDEF domain-containing protein [Pseudorhodoferax soli]|uniref:diguanylate cyclase n=1 Tax=Pseudorhodoferax soli TaxID=545864 RepID=A0A368Y7X7_9BURK|nr:GGDEF domain-containing protein [Pseudorhodoferax soli]RCW74304.1 diguanylate cyclase [Pseudorhodoferax soli]